MNEVIVTVTCTDTLEDRASAAIRDITRSLQTIVEEALETVGTKARIYVEHHVLGPHSFGVPSLRIDVAMSDSMAWRVKTSKKTSFRHRLIQKCVETGVIPQLRSLRRSLPSRFDLSVAVTCSTLTSHGTSFVLRQDGDEVTFGL